MKKRTAMLLCGITSAMLIAGCGTGKNSDDSDSAEQKIESTDGMDDNDMLEEESGENAAVKKITAEEAYQRMKSSDPIVIVDVRTKEEYDAGHIEGAILIPNEEITNEKPKLLPVEDAEILIYCRSGNRSGQAAEKLEKMGYTNINDFGGINDWTYETVDTPWEEKAGSFASFYASTTEGEIVDESIFAKAEITMINVWATYCGPCLNEMPELGELSTEYADGEVQIIGVVIDALGSDGMISQKQIEKSRELVQETKAGYMHLLPSDDLLAAGLGSVYSVPTTFFVDSSGSIVGETYIGAHSKEEWKEIIASYQ